jgi:hypothetical protein
MSRTLVLVVVFLASTAWQAHQEYAQTGSSQTGAAAGQATVQGSPLRFNGGEDTQMNDHVSADAAGQSQTGPPTRTHATAKITVQNSEARPYDESAGPELMEVQLNETFAGDIDGESPVRALQVLCGHKSAT